MSLYELDLPPLDDPLDRRPITESPTAGPAPRDRAGLDPLLVEVVARNASDLHLTVGVPPVMRLRGDLEPVSTHRSLTREDLDSLVRDLLTPERFELFERERELDFAYALPGVGRFRVNLYQQRGSYGAALRTIPREILALEKLDLPPAVAGLAHLRRGLVLVTGPTGSGKSTTLASLLDIANSTRAGHIITIEDPIEYLHTHRRCVVNQREVGFDTDDFKVALKHALRQDPDIILVGELRDLETTQVAVTAAETGHLVLATLHTRSAATTVDRMIDIFPPSQQHQIRTQLAGCLEAVVAQSLAPTQDGEGRVAVAEVMLATPAIRNLIREAKVHQIPTAMQSAGDLGMVTFDQHLAGRYLAGRIGRSVALELAHNVDEFRRLARL